MSIFRRIDLYLILPSLAISGISIFLLLSTSPNNSTQQVIFTVIGIFLFLLFSAFDFRFYPKFKNLLYILSLVLLGIIFLFPPIRSAHRWIDFGFFIFQPSEILKPFIIIVFASILRGLKKPGLPSVFLCLLLYLPLVILVFLQPDLGNTIIYLSIIIGLFIISGVDHKILLSGSVAFFIFLPAFWLVLKEYQRQRIFSFLNPSLDPSGSGYNAIQSMIAIGSGGLFGLGLGKGTQSRLLFLPEFQTDFIYASLVESLGFIGGFLLILFYLTVLIRIIFIAVNTQSRFGRFLCLGIFCQIFIQILINIGMNLGILPITGITLPLLSYGGSSIVSTYISLGMVNGIYSYLPKKLLVIR